MNFMNRFLTGGLLALVVSCGGPYHMTQHVNNGTRIAGDSLKLYDTAMANMIAPYKQKLDAQMNEVIGTATETLVKASPDGSLGNMVADACLSYANKATDVPVDFCVLNSGGIRIPAIQQGNITVGKIYELMPFDNMIDVVELNGSDCIDLFTWIVKWNGAPVAGLSLTIAEGTATGILINGVPFDSSRTYRVATSDYMANGGDGATMFAKGVRTSTNYKLRDAILEYIKVSHPYLKADNDGRIRQN